MAALMIKINKLKSDMYKKIEMNDYEINDEIVSLSQLLDELIVKYEYLNMESRYSASQG